MQNDFNEGTWFLNDQEVPQESVKSFQKSGEHYELKVEYFSALRELVKINKVKYEVEKSSGLEVKEFEVVDERRIMADEGDSGIEPGTTLLLKRSRV
ncbi:hypothetical protein KGY79_12115 [Candidatus Bipolaricaulota bacterium]|nr:hypothetical protein [Candidatus Bipolaricaulota bacterium]